MTEQSFHCQICEREIKAKSGLIAHHGYTRPHAQGWQTPSCMGARYRPYEVACDRLPAAIDAVAAHIASCKRRQAELNVPGVPVPNPLHRDWARMKHSTYGYERQKVQDVPAPPATIVPEFDLSLDGKHQFPKTYGYGRTYLQELQSLQREVERDIEYSGVTLARFEKRLADWKPAA